MPREIVKSRPRPASTLQPASTGAAALTPHARLGISADAFWRLAFEQSAAGNPRQDDDAAEEAFWRDYAPDYDVRSPLARLAVDLVSDVVAVLQPQDNLLEIGPGSGAFTRRLAPHVQSVSGVEPSAAMRETLMRQWPQATSAPPLLIPSKWEDCVVPVADVVFAANALYRIADITAALTKMAQHARRHVLLVQTVGRPHAGPLLLTGADGATLERERADALCDVLDAMSVAYRRRDYVVDRGDPEPGIVALIDWPSGA